MPETGTRERARRFPIAASLLYREHGELAWRLALTINVSRSGVLFRPDGRPPGPNRPLEFILTLPVDDALPPPHVRCTGRVVRISALEHAGGGQAVAVSIDGYALEGRLSV